MSHITLLTRNRDGFAITWVIAKLYLTTTHRHSGASIEMTKMSKHLIIIDAGKVKEYYNQSSDEIYRNDGYSMFNMHGLNHKQLV